MSHQAAVDAELAASILSEVTPSEFRHVRAPAERPAGCRRVRAQLATLKSSGQERAAIFRAKPLVSRIPGHAKLPAEVGFA